eukprot:Gb_01988 [translate_table: standard]
MPRCVRVLSSECWSKCVNATKCTSIGFNLELTRHSKKCLASKEVLGKVNLPISLCNARFQFRPFFYLRKLIFSLLKLRNSSHYCFLIRFVGLQV